jgi:hypothetical protein
MSYQVVEFTKVSCECKESQDTCARLKMLSKCVECDHFVGENSNRGVKSGTKEEATCMSRSPWYAFVRLL